ncbi:MAG TPA: ATP-binding protein [Candidatus Methylomirabilis sp.]|nr:ATP-binding protein [Candidatus Methylomirabilis sp.]
MWPKGGWNLSLRGKLLAMMFGLLMLVLAILFLMYWRAESNLIAQVEHHTTDLSTAIQISVEQLTSKGRTSEARLQDYVQRLQRRGVREISIVSNEQEVIASSNPRRVGVRVDPKRKDVLITARLGEESAGGLNQKTYNLFVPVVVSNQRSGYILISMILDDFSELVRVNFLKRLIATILVFALGIAAAVALAWTYTKPISRLVEAARRVAQGHLDERLPETRRDEIGRLNRSFNEMVEGLRGKVELEARLHQAERMSAMAHLASGIAHEVRNPLNLINLSIDHLRARFFPVAPAEQEEFGRVVDHIKQEVHRLNNMIETFLKYGKPLKLDRRPADVRTLLDEMLEVARQRAASQQVRVEREYAATMPEVWVDAPHLKTCFLNLILNAFQAMPEGGVLAVAAGAMTGPEGQGAGVGPPAPSPQPPHSNGWVEVRIQDTGIGIAPEDLSRAFEPYFTTKEVGIGLGLALTKKILEEHGGHIELTSDPGKGTVARLRLPAGVPST